MRGGDASGPFVIHDGFLKLSITPGLYLRSIHGNTPYISTKNLKYYFLQLYLRDFATATIANLKHLIFVPLLAILLAYMTSFLSQLFRPFSTTPLKAMNVPDGAQKATVAAGCFWGVEHMYRHTFDKQGLYDARVGYIGGDTENPGYRAVCTGRTGHAEALQVVYDPKQLSYRQLIEFFYKMHDPTTPNRQGPDTGTQYRSGIFYHDEEQEKIAREVTEKVQKEWWKSGKIATEILPAGQWWDAEAYHQLYLDKNPGGYECPSHFLRKFPPLS